jgi:hypothetical protein
MNSEEQAACDALAKIIPEIEGLDSKWVITGGFACYVYGVKRKLTDIDIDIDITKDDHKFTDMIKKLSPYITQPLIHFVSKSYDNYNMEITISNQIVDICTMADLKIFDKELGDYKPFYDQGFPAVEMVDFHGFSLPLMAKDLIIKNKEMIMRDDWDARDIEGLRALK